MSRPNSRFFKKMYRKEPISSFLMVMGIVDAVMGGVGEQWGLFSLGSGLVIGAMVVRWSQIRNNRVAIDKVMPRRYLPPSATNQPLPMLNQDKRQRR